MTKRQESKPIIEIGFISRQLRRTLREREREGEGGSGAGGGGAGAGGGGGTNALNEQNG